MKPCLYISALFITMLASCKKEAVVLPENQPAEIPVPADTLTQYNLQSSLKDTLCLPEGGKIVLSADNSNPNTTYRWTPGNETGAQKTVSSSGSYEVVLTTKAVTTGTITVTKCKIDTIEVNGSFSFVAKECVDAGRVLKLNYPLPKPGEFFIWIPGQAFTPYMYVTSPGYYTLNVYDSLSLKDTMSFNIMACPAGEDTITVKLNSGDFIKDCLRLSDKFMLDASVAPGADSIRYSWFPGGQTSSSIVTGLPGTYTFTAEQFIYDTLRVSVKSCEKPYFFVPNSFSPNGDGYNDIWKISARGILSVKTEVRTAEGVLLFSSETVDGAWDGTYKGSEVPDGSYLYYISYTDLSGESRSVKGQLQLRR